MLALLRIQIKQISSGWGWGFEIISAIFADVGHTVGEPMHPDNNKPIIHTLNLSYFGTTLALT